MEDNIEKTFYNTKYSDLMNKLKVIKVPKNFEKSDYTEQQLKKRIKILFCDPGKYTYENYYCHNKSFISINNEKIINNLKYIFLESLEIAKKNKNFEKMYNHKVNICCRLFNRDVNWYPFKKLDCKILFCIYLLSSNLSKNVLYELDNDSKQWQSEDKKQNIYLKHIHSYHFIDFLLFGQTFNHLGSRINHWNYFTIRKLNEFKSLNYIIENLALFQLIENKLDIEKISEKYLSWFGGIKFNNLHDEVKKNKINTDNKNLKNLWSSKVKIFELDKIKKREFVLKEDLIERLMENQNIDANDKNIIQNLIDYFDYYEVKYMLNYYNINNKNQLIEINQKSYDRINNILFILEKYVRSKINFEEKEFSNQSYYKTNQIEFPEFREKFPNYINSDNIKFDKVIKYLIEKGIINKENYYIEEIINQLRNKIKHSTLNMYLDIELITFFLESLSISEDLEIFSKIVNSNIKKTVEEEKFELLKCKKLLKEEFSTQITNCVEYCMLNHYWFLSYEQNQYITKTWLNKLEGV